MKKILCVGSVTADVMVKPADSIPEPGTLQSVESISVHTGGCASNAAMDLAKIGVPVRLCCRLGNDRFGNFVKETAQEAGVDISAVVQRDAPQTTVSVVCVQSNGERSFLYYPGSAGAFCTEDIPESAADGCEIVFVAGAMLLSGFDGNPCGTFLQKMQEAGKYTALDTGWDFEDIWLPKLKDVLPHLDLFMPSYDEAVKLSGCTAVSEMVRFFKKCGAKNLVIKMGKDGAYLSPQHGEAQMLPAFSGLTVKDTTGAGDAFCAGFLTGIARGEDFYRCGILANAVGAHCVMELGASAGIQPLKQIEEFIASYGIEKEGSL